MASTITPKLNLSLRPRQINNQPLSIFNDGTDFKNDDDVRFVNADGDVMSGVLSVPSLLITGSGSITVPSLVSSGAVTAQSLVITGTQAITLPSLSISGTGTLTVPSLSITNLPITLPTTYPAFPTSGQLGCFHKATLTTVLASGSLSAQKNYCQLPVPAGSYYLFYNFYFINNVVGTAGSRPVLH